MATRGDDAIYNKDCQGDLVDGDCHDPVSHKAIKSEDNDVSVPIDISLRTVCAGVGDAFFITNENTTGKKHCYSVDGGRGKGGAAGGPCPYTYATAVKVDEGVPLISDFLKLKAAYEDLVRNGYVLQAIMVTHPDQDHYEGIKHFLRQKKPVCPVILTKHFLQKADTPKSKGNKTPMSDGENTPKIKREKTPMSDGKNSPKIKREKTPMSDGKNTPKIKREKTPMSDGENTPKIKREKTPMSDGKNTPKIKREKTPMSDRENTPKIKRENTPMSDGENTPKIKREKTPMSDGERTLKIKEFLDVLEKTHGKCTIVDKEHRKFGCLEFENLYTNLLLYKFSNETTISSKGQTPPCTTTINHSNETSPLQSQQHALVCSDDQESVFKTCTSPAIGDKTKPLKPYQCNEASTITIVHDPTKTDQILAVLTGDAYMNDTTRTTKFDGKRILLFLVPHHGSAKNSNQNFYEITDIDVYLISCGSHGTYNFPNFEALNAINRAVATKAKKEAKMVLTNGRHLNNTKMSCVKSGTETSLLDEWKTWQSIEIYYWDEYIYEEPHNPLITKPWLDYRLYPTPQLSTDNLIQWSIEGYKKMAKSYTTKWNAEVTVTKEGMTNPYLRVMKNEISFGNQPEKLNVIKNIPSPHSPCDWDSENTTLVLTDTLDGSDGPVFLQFPDLKSTTERLWKEFTICRCHKLPWLIRYMECVNDDGTIKWSPTIYNGCQEQPAQVTVVKNN